MNLQEIYDQLVYGELSQVNLGDSNTGSMTVENKRKVIGHIQLGLTSLYKRFRLKENEILINLNPTQNIYKLKYEHLSSITENEIEKLKYPEPINCPVNFRPEDGLRFTKLDQSSDPEIVNPPIESIAIDEINETPYKKYLIETGSFDFEEDVIKIERIYNDRGNEILLNKRDDPHSIRTPDKNTIVLPKYPKYGEHFYEYLYNCNIHNHHTEYATMKQTRGFPVNEHTKIDNGYRAVCLRVVYLADHPKIDITAAIDCDSSSYNIELPQTHLLALLYFIGSRVMNPIGMANEFHAGNSYAAKYEAECQRLELDGLQIDNDGSSTSFEEAGFV